MMPLPVCVFLLGLPVIAGLPAASQGRQARIDLVMGMANDYAPLHYGILTYLDNNDQEPVNYHDAMALGLNTGDIVELDLKDDDDSDSHPPQVVQGHPGARPRRIGHVRSHQKRATEKAASTGLRSILAIRMNYQDTPENQCSESCVMTNLYTSSQSVQAMYLEDSYGALRFDTSTTSTKPRVITVSIARSIGDPCGSVQSTLDQISTEGNAAVPSSISLSQYDVRIYFTPAICGIGVSFVGEIRSYINSGSSDTLGHELGHTFGVGHSSLDSANFPRNFQVTFSQSQDVILEYGDVAGVMAISGFGMRGFVGPHRNTLGWIPSGAIVAPSLTACPIAVTLRTLFITPDSTGISMVRIPKSSGGNYFISFRTAQGQDSNMAYASKVGIHSHTGGSANTFLWKYVGVGETETTSDGLVVSVVRVTSSTADVTLAKNGVGSGCTTLSPSPSAASATSTPARTPSNNPTPSPHGQIQCGQTVQGSNVGTPNEFDVSGGDGSDVAFVFTVSTTTSVTFSMCNQASYDTLLQVFGSDKVTSLGFDDDASGCSLTSVLSLSLPAGSYFVVVDGFNGATGTFSLSATCSSASPSATPSPSRTRAVTTPTSSATKSATASLSRSASGSRSATPSVSRKAGSITASVTRSVTTTTSGTRSTSVTKSSTRSMTPTRSPTRNATPSRSHGA